MDAAHAAGLKVAFSLKDLFFGTHWCPKQVTSRAAEEPYFKKLVSQFKSHPALLAWYTNDELPASLYKEQLMAHQQWAVDTDSDHPTWQVLCENGAFDEYMGTFDVIGSDPYPIGHTNASGVRDEANSTVTLTDHARPVWEVIQAMNWNDYHPGCTACHTPTFDESRSMVWQAIAAGANGIVFYEYHDLLRNPDVSFDVAFGRLKKIAAEVLEHAPVLLSDHGAAPCPAVGATQSWLMTRAQWADHAHRSTVLFAVSDGDDGGPVDFDLSALCASASASSVTVVRTMEADPHASAPAAPPQVSGCRFTDAVPKLTAAAWNISLQSRPALKADDGSCRFINASATDARIRDWDIPRPRNHTVIHTSHWVCSPAKVSSVAEEPPLLLMIPGTGLAPVDYTLFPRHAASMGIPSIGLAYPSNMAATSACMTRNRSEHCYSGYHEALLEFRGHEYDMDFVWHGVEGPQYSLTAFDTISHRLVALLQTLQRTEPDLHWNRYLTDNTSLANGAAAVDWSRVIVAGHSQGACHVGWISKRFAVQRAIMFSGTNDITGSKRGWPGPSPAGYLSVPGATPASRLFGFGELNGGECDTWRPLWDTLNMTGPFLVDEGKAAVPPSPGAHMLCSNRSVHDGGVHGGPVQDIATPLAPDGTPIYASIWRYLLTSSVNGETTQDATVSAGKPNASNCDCSHPLPPVPPPPALKADDAVPSPPPTPARPDDPRLLPKGGAACRTDADCSLTGSCVASSCKCDAAWTGRACERLHLLPARRSALYPAGGHPTSLPSNRSFPWGGSIIKSKDGVYHLFVTEYMNRCPMTYETWTLMSSIRHATSPSIDGPWQPKELVLEAAAGNAVVVEAPDGTYVMFFTNVPDKRKLSLVRDCRSSNMSSWGPMRYCAKPADCGTGLHLAHSRSLDGPWTVQLDVVDHSISGTTNPGPLILPSGEMLLSYKGGGMFPEATQLCPEKHCRSIGVVFADRWNDWPYRRLLSTGPSVASGQRPAGQYYGGGFELEDPSNGYVDTTRGALHTLFHQGLPVPQSSKGTKLKGRPTPGGCAHGPIGGVPAGNKSCGYGGAAHSSNNGSTWIYATNYWEGSGWLGGNRSAVAYSYTVLMDDGSTTECIRREEPKLLIEDGEPAALVTQCSVMALGHTPPGHTPRTNLPDGEVEWSTVLVVQPINRAPLKADDAAASRGCSITDFGALDGNRTSDARKNAAALQAALGICEQVTVPAGGTFKIAPVTLPSNRVLFLEAGSSLVGSDKWQDYGVTLFMPPMGKAQQLRPLLSAENASNITVTGQNGTIDGNGWFAWPAANWSSSECGLHNRCAPDVFFGLPAQKLRPAHVLTFIRANDVTLHNLTITNPGFWGVQHFYCNRSKSAHVTILAPRWTREIAGFMPWSVVEYVVEDSFVHVG